MIVTGVLYAVSSVPHDDQTEVLTRTGWKLLAHTEKDDELATVDSETAILKYEKPRRLIVLPYAGSLIRGFHRYMDFCVTLDHKMVVRPWDQKTTRLRGDYVLREAKDLGWYSGLLTRVRWTGGESAKPAYTLHGDARFRRREQRKDRLLSMAAWLQFLGIYLAEGTMIRRDDESRIQIAAAKAREREFVINTLRLIGIETSHNVPDRFSFTNQRIYAAMEALGLLGVYAPDKFVPAFVFEQTVSNIKELLLGHFTGDGCYANTQGFRRHYTSSKRLADDLQRLIFLSGDEAYVRVREPRNTALKDGRRITGRYPEYCVSVRESRTSSIQRMRHVTKVPYNGRVFGAEVSAGRALVTRRKGFILVSGN